MPYSEFQDQTIYDARLQLLIAVSFFAFIAGDVNTTLIMMASRTVSHVTGNLSYLGEFLAAHSFTKVFQILFTILSFFLGTVISGLFLVKQKYSLKWQYGLITLFEGLMLLLAAKLGKNNISFSIYLCSLGMGMQNAMVSSYKGMVIRTTHMTGIITDLGFLIGSSFRKGQWPLFKILFFVDTLLFFLTGCICAYFLTKIFAINNLYLAGSLTMFAALLYYFWRSGITMVLKWMPSRSRLKMK